MAVQLSARAKAADSEQSREVLDLRWRQASFFLVRATRWQRTWWFP